MDGTTRHIRLARLFWTILLLLAIALVVTLPPLAHAASITVTDVSGGTGTPGCKLRDAITAANTDTATGGCPAGSGPDIIVLPTKCTITLTTADNAGGTVEANGLPTIYTDITIYGNDSIIERSSGGIILPFRIFSVLSSGTLSLYDVTIRNGKTGNGSGSTAGGDGGGIRSYGTVNLTNSSITDNWGGDGSTTSRGGRGAGIFSAGPLSINASTISGNQTGDGSSGGDGGGVYIGDTTYITNTTISGNTTGDGSTNEGGTGGGLYINGATVSITGSTVNGNTAGNSVESRGGTGGGIFMVGGGTVNITNSTIVNNRNGSGTLTAQGGGIANGYGTLVILNSTFVGNSATGSGGGVFGAVTLKNSIVANNSASSGANCSGTITNGGNNIDSGTSCGWGSTDDSKSNTNPLLGPLANYGGPTQTMAPFPGSPAVDGVTFNAPNDSPSVDQRGVARPVGVRHDIGAFEGVLPMNYLPMIRRAP